MTVALADLPVTPVYEQLAVWWRAMSRAIFSAAACVDVIAVARPLPSPFTAHRPWCGTTC